MPKHIMECFLAKPCRHNNGVHVMQESVANSIPVNFCGLCMDGCICEELGDCRLRTLNEVYSFVTGLTTGPENRHLHSAVVFQIDKMKGA